MWALFIGGGGALSHFPYVVFRGTAGGDWFPVAKEGMTGPESVKAPSGGSYPGPISALGADSAALLSFTPPVYPNPVELVFATENGRSLTPAKPDPIPGLAEPAAAGFVSARAGWVLGRKGETQADVILATTDGGRTWRAQYSRHDPGR